MAGSRATLKNKINEWVGSKAGLRDCLALSKNQGEGKNDKNTCKTNGTNDS